MRGGGLPPHHLFPRPPRRAGALHGDAARRPRALSGAAVERQPASRAGALDGRPPLRDAGTTRFPSRPTCSRWSRATSPRSRTRSRRDRAARSRCAIYSTPRNLPRCRARDGVAQARDALGRGALRPRVRPRPLHDRLRRRLQHGRDGEQGPQHLQQQATCSPIPATATDDDYQAIEGVVGHEYFHNWTGNRVTCRDWFQLSLKEGLTVFRDQEFSSRHGLARGRAHRRGRLPARARSSPRTRARWRTRCGPTSTSRSTTSTRRRSTRRAPR